LSSLRKTLMAFNEISQGALNWNEGELPDQLTQHTELADDRTAGFLHLRLRHAESGEMRDFLLPDLPGEWTKSLVDKDRNDRLQFLKRADVIWLMMDGAQLRDEARRLWAVHRMQMLTERLRTMIGTLPPLVLVLTRRDDGPVPESAYDDLIEEAHRYGCQLSVVQIASFADDADVRPGFNVDVLMEACRSKPATATPCWPPNDEMATESRAMLRYRSASNDR
jgi:hypothetical protein